MALGGLVVTGGVAPWAQVRFKISHELGASAWLGVGVRVWVRVRG